MILLGTAWVSWSGQQPMWSSAGARSALSMRQGGGNKLTRRANLLRDLEITDAVRREPDGPWEEDPATPLALAAARAGDARKARDVSALRVGHLTSATNYFVNMVGGSKAQIDAIVKSVEDSAAEMGRKGNRQGKAPSGWVCIDYDDVVVNVFSEEQRDFYRLERFWNAAQTIDLSDVLVPNLAPGREEPEPDAGDAGGDAWLLGDDDDWTLDDEDWGLPSPAEYAPPPPAAPAEPPATAQESAAPTLQERLAALSQRAAEEVASDAAARAAAAAKEYEDDDEEEEEEVEDWALGDDNLRALVERLEGEVDGTDEDDVDDADADAAGGWRSRMLEDGLLDADGEDVPAWELETEGESADDLQSSLQKAESLLLDADEDE